MKKRKPIKPVEVGYDKEKQDYYLKLNDKNLFPLRIIILDKLERVLKFEKGKKGDSLFMN